MTRKFIMFIVFLLIAAIVYSAEDKTKEYLLEHKGNGKIYKMRACIFEDNHLIRMYDDLILFNEDNSFEIISYNFEWKKLRMGTSETHENTSFAGNYKLSDKELILTVLKIKDKNNTIDLKERAVDLIYQLPVNDNINLKMELKKISDLTSGIDIDPKDIKYKGFTGGNFSGYFIDSGKLSEIAKKNKFRVYNVSSNKELAFFAGKDPLYYIEDVKKYFADMGQTFNTAKNFNDICGEIKNGDLEKVKKLVVKDSDLNFKNSDGMTSLIYACFLNRFEIAKFLIEKGADVNAETNKGITGIMFASDRENLDFVKYMAEIGAEVNAKTSDGRTALLIAAYKGNLDIIKFLVEKKADVNAKNSDGQTALMAAAAKNKLNIVKYLAENTADVNAKDKNGDSALLYVSDFGFTDIAKFLIEKGADVNVKNKEGDSALYWANYNKHPQIIKLLKDAGAKE
jgi:ankyrin repeat protein